MIKERLVTWYASKNIFRLAQKEDKLKSYIGAEYPPAPIVLTNEGRVKQVLEPYFIKYPYVLYEKINEGIIQGYKEYPLPNSIDFITRDN